MTPIRPGKKKKQTAPAPLKRNPRPAIRKPPTRLETSGHLPESTAIPEPIMSPDNPTALALVKIARLIGVPLKPEYTNHPQHPETQTEKSVARDSEKALPTRPRLSIVSVFQAPQKKGRLQRRPWYIRYFLLDRPFLILAIVLLTIWLVPAFIDRMAALDLPVTP